jgi:hypothetical protein
MTRERTLTWLEGRRDRGTCYLPSHWIRVTVLMLDSPGKYLATQDGIHVWHTILQACRELSITEERVELIRS